MKAIMVMFDSLNRRYLPPYGCDWVHAPNFERLAAHTATFDNCYIGSMPCIPARRELHTGRYNFLHRSWGPLEPFDDSMPQLLKENGVYTHLVTDHQHYWEDGGATYHNRYTSYEFARGQEGDFWKGMVADPEIPEHLPRTAPPDTYAGIKWRQDWVNRSFMDEEARQPQTVTFDNGVDFIRRNYQEDNWFLQIEEFDPHEPFFTQEGYKALYDNDYDGPHFDWPEYARVAENEQIVQHARREYAALLSMCDQNLGRVLDLMDENALWDDTMLIVCTDHGYLLGEHGWWAKNKMPWYNELARIPLFIWDPRSHVQGERRQALVQMIDLAPTLLEYFDLERPPDMQGVPLRKTIVEDNPVRDYCLFGHHGGHVNITDGRGVYMRSCVRPDNRPLYEYTLMPTHINRLFSPAELQDTILAEPFSFTKGCRTMKIEGEGWSNPYEYGTLLFDLAEDPAQQTPRNDPEVERRMIAQMVRLMQANDCPSEQFERLGLPPDGQAEELHLMLGKEPLPVS